MTNLAKVRELLDEAEGILCDIDGCLLADKALLLGATAFLERYGDRVALLSNNSTDIPEDIAAKLSKIGIDLPMERIVLAGDAAVKLTAEMFSGASIQMIATAQMRNRARELGIHLVEHTGDIMLICRNEAAAVCDLQAAIDTISAGAAVIVANSDITHPSARLGPRIETGALWALISACVPGATARFVGKPEPHLFEIGMSRLGSAPGTTVMIGDNPFTDGSGARRLGICTVMVSSPQSSGAASLGEIMNFRG